MVGVPTMIVSAKTVQVILPLLLLVALAGAAARDRIAAAKPSLDAPALGLLAFLAYAGLSALWAPAPEPALLIVMMAALVYTGSLMLVALLRAESRDDALHMGEGLWIGLAVGAVYTIAEIATGQGIKMGIYNALELGADVLEPDRYFTWQNGRVVAIHPDDLTRNVVPMPFLLWPALMAASALPNRAWRLAVSGALIVACAAAVLLATSETAKLALLAGLLALLIARLSTRLVQYAASLAWAILCLAMVPLVFIARHLELQNADWLQLSAKLRITIWNEIALRVADAPILGVGADMTYYIRPHMREAPAAATSWTGFPITHPHNIFLQVWYELGAVGALLFTIFGILALNAIAKLDASQRPYGFAMAAALAVQISFSYNLWQIWFMCLFGFAAAMFAVGLNASEPPRSEVARQW
jgi:O-antigen ligase